MAITKLFFLNITGQIMRNSVHPLYNYTLIVTVGFHAAKVMVGLTERAFFIHAQSELLHHTMFNDAT